MSELRMEFWTMPAADLGPENPLPPLNVGGRVFETEPSVDIPPDIYANIGYGNLPSILPYKMQDGYTRELRSRDFRVAVLENEHLRATFLLEYGARLWSLLHKPSGRELLEVNPVLQFANLGLRGAWFSGGVEWNIGMIGHSVFTCAPLFATRVDRSDGTPILRLYEWERIRQVCFQIDAYLPDESRVLFVRVRILNSSSQEVPMYWWSNMAVPETPGMRVLAPADSAYCLGCNGSDLVRVPVPVFNNTDFSHPDNVSHASDFFFHVPDGNRPWIASLDADGKGLVHTSSKFQFGRKLWVWGQASGGRRWQEFLSPPGQGYVEIQAGIARTQLEQLRMPPGTEWTWQEAYGLLEVDPGKVHNEDWSRAWQSAEAELEKLIPAARLDAEFKQGAKFADVPPSYLLQLGSGWGALERKRREHSGDNPLDSRGLQFPDESLGEEQAPWIKLLENGGFPEKNPDQVTPSFIVQSEWRSRLEEATKTKQGANWFTWLQLGVMRHYQGENRGARDAWEQSLALSSSPWAARNLAVLARDDGDLDTAATLLASACRAMPAVLPLAVECGQCLIEANREQEWLDLLTELPESIRSRGRIRLLEAQAALRAGDLPLIERFFSEGVTVADLREGETTLSDLWFFLHEHKLSQAERVPIDAALRDRVRGEFPVPAAFDFRMSAG